MQIAAASPHYVKREEVPETRLQRNGDLHRQALESGKPEKVIEKIVEGKMERFIAKFAC